MKLKIFAFFLAIALPAIGRDALSRYVDTMFGWNPHYMLWEDLPHALESGLKRELQQSMRFRGVPTSSMVLDQRHAPKEKGWRAGGWILFPERPQRFMPYLDSLFVPGNTCAEPCRILHSDVISLGAQRAKTLVSQAGLQYSANATGNYTAVTAVRRQGRHHFVSTNNEVNGTWFLAKHVGDAAGVFLTFEADWGQGVGFSESRDDARTSIGSLSNPQGSYRRSHGLFVPNLALGCSLFDGRWVGMIGTLDVSNFLDQNAYSGSWNGNLLNQSFNNNPALPLEWGNWGYMTAWQPSKSLYALYATTGTNAPVNHNPFHYISSKAWAHLGEIGLVREDVLGLGAGIYRFQYVITRQTTPSSSKAETGSGAAVNIQQQLGRNSRVGFFTRCAYLDEDAAAVSGVREAATVGFVLQAPFREKGWGSAANNDQVALGVLWEQPAERSKPFAHRSEYGVELSAVVQMTPTFFLQPDVQYIFHPAFAAEHRGAWIFQVQTGFKF